MRSCSFRLEVLPAYVYIDSVRIIAESGSSGGGLTGEDALAYADPDGDGLE